MRFISFGSSVTFRKSSMELAITTSITRLDSFCKESTWIFQIWFLGNFNHFQFLVWRERSWVHWIHEEGLWLWIKSSERLPLESTVLQFHAFQDCNSSIISSSLLFRVIHLKAEVCLGTYGMSSELVEIGDSVSSSAGELASVSPIEDMLRLLYDFVPFGATAATLCICMVKTWLPFWARSDGNISSTSFRINYIFRRIDSRDLYRRCCRDRRVKWRYTLSFSFEGNRNQAMKMGCWSWWSNCCTIVRIIHRGDDTINDFHH